MGRFHASAVRQARVLLIVELALLLGAAAALLRWLAGASPFQTMAAAMLFLFVFGAILALIHRHLTLPIRRLANYVVAQEEDGDNPAPPAALLRREDDIGRLATEINRLLAKLKEQNEQLLEQTLYDPLTGLGNRRLLDWRLRDVLPLSRRMMTPLSALMIDVDHFKAYNDFYGHPAGDECLKEIANVLRDTFRRETDILIRQGGEEFLVVLLNVAREDSLELAEAMRGMLQLVALPHEKSSVAAVVTVSIGVATIEPGTLISVDELIASADEALYECKRTGRNRSVSRVVSAETLEQAE